VLEAMAEGQVTVDGSRTSAGAVFPPRDRESDRAGGNVSLPEAQARPVFLRTALGYPISTRRSRSSKTSSAAIRSTRCGPWVAEADSTALQEAVEEVYVDELLRRWIVELVRATRSLDFVALGASVQRFACPRARGPRWRLIEGRTMPNR